MRSVFAFLGGAVVGAAVALLLAPEKGEVTRRKIGNAVKHGVDEVEAKARQLRNKACGRKHHSELEEIVDSISNL